MRNFKIFVSVVLILVLTLSLSANAFASDKGGFLYDGANMLTDSEESRLEKALSNFAAENNFEIYISTVESIGNKTMQSYAHEMYRGTGDGLFLVVEYVRGGDDNEFWIEAFGYGDYAFNSYGITYLEDKLYSYLSDERFFEGFDKYIDLSDDFLVAAREGEPYSSSNKFRTSKDIALTYGLILAISLAIGLTTVLVMKYTMNNARPQKLAHEYVKKGSFNLRVSRDLYLYSHTTRTPRSNSSSSGGRSRGGGGGRKF
jgi:uncharacterized protein